MAAMETRGKTYPMWEYWKSVLAEAWGKARADLGLDSVDRIVIRVILGAVVLGLLLAAQPIQGIDRFRLVTIVIVVTVVALPVVWLWKSLRVAAERDENKSKVIEEQNKLLASLSPLEFRAEPKDHRTVAWLHDVGPFGHVVLFNAWSNKSARNAEVQLVRITRLDAKGDPTRDQFSLDGLPIGLVTRDGDRRKDIPPEDEEAFVLCEAHWAVDPTDTDQIDRPSQITIAPGRAGGRNLILPADRYRFEVVAKGLDISPRRQTYVLDATATSFAYDIEKPNRALKAA